MPKWNASSPEKLKGALLSQPKTKIALLRRQLPTIEQALADGHTYSDCVRELSAVGLTLTEPYFRIALARLRAEVKSSAQHFGPTSLDPVSSSHVDQTSSGATTTEHHIQPGEASPVGKDEGTFSERNGVRVYRPKQTDHGTNRTPSMKDFL